jgi:hypothetical protein
MERITIPMAAEILGCKRQNMEYLLHNFTVMPIGRIRYLDRSEVVEFAKTYTPKKAGIRRKKEHKTNE